MNPKPRILYIDDEADILSLACSFFEEEQLDIDTCDDFTRALEMIKQNAYDLIISDERMPSGSGSEFISFLKEENIYTKNVILVTGNLDFHAGQKRMGGDLVLNKPIDFQELVTHARRILKF